MWYATPPSASNIHFHKVNIYFSDHFQWLKDIIKDTYKRVFNKLFVIFLIHAFYLYLLHTFRRCIKYNLTTLVRFRKSSPFFLSLKTAFCLLMVGNTGV